MAAPRVSLTRTAEKHADKLATAFQRNLRQVAIAVADQDRVEVASPKHVDVAFNVLASLGLASTPWYRRPELKVGLGGFFLGAAGGISDVLGGLANYGPLSWLRTLSAPAIVVCLLVGVFLAVWGWFSRHLLPSGPSDGLLARLRCWPWVIRCEHRAKGEAFNAGQCDIDGSSPASKANAGATK